jgi:hypothetical protein
MGMETLQTVNRAVLIVRPKQPFLDWLQSLPDPAETTLAELRADCTTFLIPEYVYETDLPDIIRKTFETIFAVELDAWWLDTDDWPDTTDFELFQAWFDVEVHSMVVNLAPGPITLEDL